MKNKETRIFEAPKTFRAAAENENGLGFIDGKAIIFGQRSKLIYENGQLFYEVIERGAVDHLLNDPELNCIATKNHIRELMLARTKSGTLILRADDEALHYSINVPNTTLGRDMKVQIERRDYYESSYIYTVLREHVKWSTAEDGHRLRTISKLESLHDIAIVTDGASANTEVAARELKEIIEKETPTVSNLSTYKRKLTLRKLKL